MSEYIIEVADALEFVSRIEPDSIDAVISDAPFGILNEAWDIYGSSAIVELFPALFLAMKPEAWGVIFVNHWDLTEIKKACDDAGFRFADLLVWHKQSNTLSSPVEIAIRFKKQPVDRFTNKPLCMYVNTVASRYRQQEIDGGYVTHPCRKPLNLMRSLVLDYSSEYDVVLDMFLGSGTTAVACALESRYIVACDSNEEYFEDAVWRLRNYRIFA